MPSVRKQFPQLDSLLLWAATSRPDGLSLHPDPVRHRAGRPVRRGLESHCMSDVTRILSAIGQGDPHAAGELLPLVYDELRKLAAHKMAQDAAGQTLQPTALVHEAYLRLV